MGSLYIVPTPIGNLEDITLRALRILREVDLIAAEDTRVSRVLTRHFDIDTPLTSYHEHNKLSKLERIFAALEQGDVALISDAGTPGISDPGAELIREAIDRGLEVVPLPGANAAITALVASGMAADRFVFIGFLPRKANALRRLLSENRDERGTIIAYESPWRLAQSLALVVDAMGADRQVCVAREISKKYETFFRGTAMQAHDHFQRESSRGEVTLLIAGAENSETRWDEAAVEAALAERLAAGESLSSAARWVAQAAGWTKKAVYQLGIKQRT